MTSNLPLEVLGLVGPVLGWVEGVEGLGFPEVWVARSLSSRRREKAWLVRELPTYSEDTVEEIVRGARDWGGPRATRGGPPGPEPRLPALLRGGWQAQVAPPADYRLADVFLKLSRRYFEWRGTEMTIRSGRMEELHELAMRFPVGHLVRHFHAQAVARGFLTERRAVRLPEQLGLLHTSSHGLRSVVGRGLAEGHLHLWGVLTGAETWADHLLRPLPPGILRGYERQEERLFLLSRVALRLLAFAVLQVMLRPEARPPFHLVGHLDALYLAAGELEERLLRARLREQLRTVTLPEVAEEPATGTGGGSDVLVRALASPDPAVRDLLRLAHPVVDRLRRHRQRRGRRPEGDPTEGIRHRLHLIDRLHLTVHRLLLAGSEGSRPAADDDPRFARRSREAGSREFLNQVFFRYLVYQTHHWQLSTQSGRTTGLRYFKRYMGAHQRDMLDREGVETQGLIIERLRKAGSLKTVEGRISPPSSTDDLVPWILGYAEGASAGELDGFGLVVHFIKAEAREVEDRRLPDTRRRLIHGRVRRRTRQQAKELFYLLSRSHPAVPFIVGIDAANLELTTPPEVFAPAFRFLRDYPIEPRPPSSPWERFGAHAEVASLLHERRLGLTYHVGEDFRHLISGLRAIDEVIRFLRPRPGDRLGHGIALALDPEVWMKQNGYQAVVPKLEALDDLVWVLQFLGAGNDTLGELGVEAWIQQLSREIYGAAALPDEPWLRDLGERVETLEMEIERLRGEAPLPVRSSRTFLPPRLQWNWSALTLHHAWRLRQLDPYLLDLESALHGRPRLRDAPENSRTERRWIHVQRRVLAALVDHGAASRSAFHLLSLHWYHDQVRDNGDELLNIDMQPDRHLWIRLCREVQAKMKREVDRRQLIVEVNPSSNRLVGPMESFGEHHVFQMSLDEEGNPDRHMRVTVNTDDPGVFNTSLPHEYYLLGEILLERGVPEPKVEEWLEWLRRNGEDASFTRALPRSDDPRVRQVLQSLVRTKAPISERLDSGDSLSSFWNRLRRGHRELHRDELGARLHRLEEAHRRRLGGDPDLGPRPG